MPNSAGIRTTAPALTRLAETVVEDAREWAAGRMWLPRLALLAYLAWAGVRHLLDPLYGSWFGGLTFGIHELGHVLFSPLGEFLSIAGGSLCQVAAPVAAAIVMVRQRDWFGVAVSGAWLGFSLFNLATYIGDARALELPLLGLSDEPEHDWNYLLGTFGMLRLDGVFAFLTRVAAFAAWLGAMLSGGWLCREMKRSQVLGKTG